MARTRTLAELRDDVLWQADKEGFTQRHTPARVNRAVNQAIQEYREHVSSTGSPYFLASTPAAAMAPGAASGMAFGSILVGTNLGRIYGVDVTVNGVIRPLRSIEFDSRNDFQGSLGPPEHFFLYNQTTIGILPAPDAAYSYVIWYLPPHTDLANDGEAFDGQYGWEEFVVFNACAKLHIRDDEPERQAAVFSERQRLLEDIKSSSGRNRQGAQKRQDVRARHAQALRNWQWSGGGVGSPAAVLPVSVLPASLGDGTTRADLIFQQYVDALSALGGGELWVPYSVAGYRFDAPVTLRRYVNVRGMSRGMGRGHKVLDYPSNIGSTILVNHTGVCINMEAETCIDGLEFYYPNQVLDATPVVHDWTIKANVSHANTIRNVKFTNAYRGIFLASDGALVENVQGWAIETGIQLGRCGDVVRLAKVHFNPNSLPGAGSTLLNWNKANGVGIKVDGAEFFEASDIHTWGYLKGLWMVSGGVINGSTGVISNIGFDQVGVGIEIGDHGTSFDGLKFANVTIIPTLVGIKISDTTQGGTFTDTPRLMFTNLSVFNGLTYERAMWVETNSKARVWITNCQFGDFTLEGVLNQSANSKGRLFGAEMQSGPPRITNTGGGSWTETAAM